PEDLRPARAHVEAAPHHDRRRPAGAVVRVDEARIKTGERDDDDLRQVPDPQPEHHDREEHDLRDRIAQEHGRTQELIQTSREPRTRWRSRRYSTRTSVEPTRTWCAPASTTWTLPTWCTVRGAGVLAWARGCWN